MASSDQLMQLAQGQMTKTPTMGYEGIGFSNTAFAYVPLYTPPGKPLIECPCASPQRAGHRCGLAVMRCGVDRRRVYPVHKKSLSQMGLFSAEPANQRVKVRVFTLIEGCFTMTYWDSCG